MSAQTLDDKINLQHLQELVCNTFVTLSYSAWHV